MCGRYVEVSSPKDLAPLFEATVAPELEGSWRPSWNISPTRSVLGVANEHKTGERMIHEFRWGLVPSWAKELSAGARTFNARAEGVAVRPSYRASFKSKRAIVPADAFYEWSHRPDEAKQPYAFERSDGTPLAFAGLYDFWRDKNLGEEAPWVASATIITTGAGPDMDGIHDRQPLVSQSSSTRTGICGSTRSSLTGRSSRRYSFRVPPARS